MKYMRQTMDPQLEFATQQLLFLVFCIQGYDMGLLKQKHSCCTAVILFFLSVFLEFAVFCAIFHGWMYFSLAAASRTGYTAASRLYFCLFSSIFHTAGAGAPLRGCFRNRVHSRFAAVFRTFPTNLHTAAAQPLTNYDQLWPIMTNLGRPLGAKSDLF